MRGRFTKRRPDAPAGFFAVEAAGLAWLAAAGPAAAAVVGVHQVGTDQIELEELRPARPTRAAAEQFGRALAVTHRAGAAAFGQGPEGWSGDGFIGRQPLSLRPSAAPASTTWPTRSWGRFYAEQRVLPYARRASRLGHLSAAGLSSVELVADQLQAGTWDDGESPSRIHGDLWAGNLMFTDRGAVLIDPAAHGGHGVTDLAMLELFGAPHLDAVTGAYADAAGWGPDWRTLVALHQLHPLLVHAVSHGPNYGAQAARVARQYL